MTLWQSAMLWPLGDHRWQPSCENDVVECQSEEHHTPHESIATATFLEAPGAPRRGIVEGVKALGSVLCKVVLHNFVSSSLLCAGKEAVLLRSWPHPVSMSSSSPCSHVGESSSIPDDRPWGRRVSSRGTSFLPFLLLATLLFLRMLWGDLVLPLPNFLACDGRSTMGPILFAQATAVHYRGSVYHGLTEEMVERGGSTFTIQVSIPIFPTNVTRARQIVMSILADNVRLIDEEGNLRDTDQVAYEFRRPGLSRSWRPTLTDILARSEIEVTPDGHFLKVTFASGKLVLPAHTSALVVPHLPFSLFGQEGRLGLKDLPNNYLAGDPFFLHKKALLRLDETRWNPLQQRFVTGAEVAVPLIGPAKTISDRLALERGLRVMEGRTCVHSRSAYVRGSRWDIHDHVYRFTPHRGGVQTLCYVPYPDTLPSLGVKLMNSYEVEGPEGLSTDPPQVQADLEFTGTIYGTNLTERDTAVITDELCTDFTSQNVFFIDLFFSSSSRASFLGTFHKRGIYHVCYHRDGSPAYVQVSTLFVERGRDVVIDDDSPNVLVDQDVKLLQSASVTRLKVQEKGNLHLHQRSLTVSYFVWSGGTISGKGAINCTGYAKVTTQGYETRRLSVPLYNYGEMTIDVQRLSLELGGAIHNYGNLTLAVSSMGVDSISSVTSASQRNVITNYPGGVVRIIALDGRSYALLTGRFIFEGGSVLFSGKFNLTDASSFGNTTVTLKSGTLVTVDNIHLASAVVVEEGSVLTLMKGCVAVSATVSGNGVMRLLGQEVVLNSLQVNGSIRVLFAGGPVDPISVVIYGTTQFGGDTFVQVTHANFVTPTGLAKVSFHGGLLADFVTVCFRGNIILQIGGVAVLYGEMSNRVVNFRSTPAVRSDDLLPLATSSFVLPNATMFVIDTLRLNEAFDVTSTSHSVAVEDNLLMDNFLGHCIANVSTTERSQSCEVYLPTSQYLTMSGRLVVRGCVEAPSGGIISGAVVKLEDPADWALVHRMLCTLSQVETLPHLCRRPHRIAPPLRSGLALSGKVYLRHPTSLLLDELTLVSSHTRLAHSVPVNIREAVIVRADSTLSLAHGMVLEARHIVIEGTLVVHDPRNTILKGAVEVRGEGIIELHGASEVSCKNELLVEGSLHLALPSKGQHFRCRRTTHDNVDAEHSKSASSNRIREGSRQSDDRLDALLRKRALANLSPDMACPDDVIHDYESRRQFITLYWLRQAYDPPPDQPTKRDMIFMTLFGVISCFITFQMMLTIWEYTRSKWLRDLLAPCPLQLTLTWDELSCSTVNYFSLCRLIILSLQNTLASFHPGLPAPLPSVAGVLLRGMGLLMPHHQTPLSRSRKIGIFYIAWLLVFLYTNRQGSSLLQYLRRRHLFLLDVAQHLYSVLTILNLIFLAPLMSSVVDAFAWPTLLRNVPTYEPVRLDIWVVLSVISFFAMGVMAPSSILTNQLRIPHMDLRVRASTMFMYFSTQMWETVMWKVFYNNPMCMVFNSIFFQLIRFGFLWWFPPTPYKNVNRFMIFLTLQSFFVYPAILLYAVLLRTGVYTSCTQGTDMFRSVAVMFAFSLFTNFWRNILFVEEHAGTCGDVSIDALRCSMTQVRKRIHDLKLEVYACTDTRERENVLNAIARLRIEYLEKQERYRLERHRLLRPFIFGELYLKSDTPLQSNNSVAPYGNYDIDDSTGALRANMPNMQFSCLLSVEEMETFSCGPALGKGSYGTVHLGILTNGKLVAVKYVNIVSESPETLASVKAEVNMLRELSHPNIIRYFGAHTIHDTMLVFMEFAVGGSLTSIVRKFTHLTEAVMQLYTFQILRGLQYLHGKGVVHRDIKGENILIDGYGVAKLADFGCSKSLANIANAAQVGCGTLVGSPFWMAPEVIRSEAYGTKADIWSVGCTVVEMLNGGEPPWREEFDNVYSAMFYVGSTNEIPQIPEDTSATCREFLFLCFERDVMKRASADELLQHPWLRMAAAVSNSDDAADTFPNTLAFSQPSLKPTYDGEYPAHSHSTLHSSREDSADLQNDATTPLATNREKF